MKRVLFALLFHCLIVFICLFCYVHYKWSIPELIPGMAFSYKLLTSAQLLLMWLPAALGSAYIVAYSKIFGQDDKHIMVKYSPYILTQFKFVAIFAIVATTLVICGQEVGSPLIKQRLRHMEEAPALYKEYMQAAHQYYESGDLVFAVQYAEAAERLHPLSQEAVTLKSMWIFNPVFSPGPTTIGCLPMIFITPVRTELNTGGTTEEIMQSEISDIFEPKASIIFLISTPY